VNIMNTVDATETDVADVSFRLRSEADVACSKLDWHAAASLYSQAVTLVRKNLPRNSVTKLSGRSCGDDSATSWERLRPLCLALLGRSRALTEIGRQRAELDANPAIVAAAIADARAALSLARHSNQKSDVAVAAACLSDVLVAAGRSAEGQVALTELLSVDPGNEELSNLVTNFRKRQLAAQMDAFADDGRSPGTFRWPVGTILPPLPIFPEHWNYSTSNWAHGWESFLRARGGEALIAAARTHPALLDGLSFPLSLGWVLASSSVRWACNGQSSPSRVLHVIVLGATARAETRIWQETSYWQELENLLADKCKPHIEFVGPEVDVVLGPVHCLNPPCAQRFLSARPHLSPANTVCVVYNGGFGSVVAGGPDHLLLDWLPDLKFLAHSRFLCVFFCANDFADVRGEVAVHSSILKSHFALVPQRNPFAMATVYSGDPDSGNEREWFCGNSFAYATCGCDAKGLIGMADVIQGNVTAELYTKKVVYAAAHSSAQFEVDCVKDTPLLFGPDLAQETAGIDEALPLDHDLRQSGAEAAQPNISQSGMDHLVAASAAEYESVPQTGASRPLPSIAHDQLDVSINVMNGANGECSANMEIRVPSCMKVRALDLQISNDGVLLANGPGNLVLRENWPKAVDATRGSATFSSKRRSLIISAPLLCTGQPACSRMAA